MSRERIARAYSKLEKIIEGIKCIGPALHIGMLASNLADVSRMIEEAIQDVMDVPAPGSITIAEEPQLKLSDEEVWLRAWVAAAQPGVNRKCTEWADECLKQYKERFRKETVENET